MNMNTARGLMEAAADWQGRDMRSSDLINQIGMGNFLAISGGRWNKLSNSTISLPVSSGYHVTVTLEGNDTYTVRRLFVRNGKATVKTEARDVYADQVGEIAYQASCYKN